MELFKLFGSVMVDNKKANQSIQKTDSLASKLSKGLGKGIKTAAKWGAGIAAGAIAGGTALLGVASKASETADRVDKMSQKVRMSREGFQEWDHAIAQSGGNIEGLQGGMKKLTDAMDGAVQGGKANVETFARLGISMEEVSNSSPEEMFGLLVSKFNEMPDSAEKAALANDVFGRSATDLAPMLNSSAEEVARLKQEAHDLGLVMGNDAIDAGVLFGDTMDNVKDSFSMLVTDIGISVMPMIQSFLDWVIANMPTIQAVAQEVFSKVGEFVTAAVDIFQAYFLPAISAVIEWVKTNWPTIQEVIKSVMDTVKSIIEAVTGLIKTIWEKWGDQIKATIEVVWGIVKSVIETTINVVKGIIQTVTALIKGDWEGVWNGIKAIFTSIWDGIKGYVDTVINKIKNIIKSVLGSIKSTISGIWNGIKTKTSNTWDSIKSAIEKPINKAKEIVKGAIDKIKGFFNFSWSLPKLKLPHLSITGKLSIAPPSVPRFSIDWYAKGAVFDKPTLFGTAHGIKGVGEKGPEAVAPISKLQEMIDWNTTDNSGLERRMDMMIDLLSLLLGKEFATYLDGRKVSKELAPRIDKELGKLNERRAY